MNKDLHDIDSAFKRAYQSYEDIPSENAWEKINATLDKADADKYKRRFIGWKRIAVVLALLLSLLLIHVARVMNKQYRVTRLADKDGVNDPDNSTYKKNKISESNNNTAEHENVERNKNKTTGRKINILPETILPNKQNRLYRGAETHAKEIENNSQSGSIVSKERIWKAKSGYKINQRTVVQKEVKSNHGFEEGLSENKMQVISPKSYTNQTPDLLRYSPDLLTIKKLSEVNKAYRLNQLSGFDTPVINKKNWFISLLKSKINQSSAPLKPYWSLTIFASNDWSQYHLDNDDEDNSGVTQDEPGKISIREKHESSFSAGILATRQFRKNIGIRSGILYSNITIVISPQEMYAVKEPAGIVTYKYVASSGYGYVNPGFGVPPAIGDSIQSTEARHNLYTIGIPVMALYTWQKNKFSISPAVGLSANFITGAKIETEIKDALNRETVIIDKLNGMRNFYIGLMTDMNIQYQVNNKWSLGVVPGFKYALTPITQKNVVKTFPYCFNIGAGITYNF